MYATTFSLCTKTHEAGSRLHRSTESWPAAAAAAVGLPAAEDGTKSQYYDEAVAASHAEESRRYRLSVLVAMQSRTPPIWSTFPARRNTRQRRGQDRDGRRPCTPPQRRRSTARNCSSRRTPACRQHANCPRPVGRCCGTGAGCRTSTTRTNDVARFRSATGGRRLQPRRHHVPACRCRPHDRQTAAAAAAAAAGSRGNQMPGLQSRCCSTRRCPVVDSSRRRRRRSCAERTPTVPRQSAAQC